MEKKEISSLELRDGHQSCFNLDENVTLARFGLLIMHTYYHFSWLPTVKAFTFIQIVAHVDHRLLPMRVSSLASNLMVALMLWVFQLKSVAHLKTTWSDSYILAMLSVRFLNPGWYRQYFLTSCTISSQISILILEWGAGLSAPD